MQRGTTSLLTDNPYITAVTPDHYIVTTSIVK